MEKTLQLFPTICSVEMKKIATIASEYECALDERDVKVILGHAVWKISCMRAFCPIEDMVVF